MASNTRWATYYQSGDERWHICGAWRSSLDEAWVVYNACRTSPECTAVRLVKQQTVIETLMEEILKQKGENE